MKCYYTFKEFKHYFTLRNKKKFYSFIAIVLSIQIAIIGGLILFINLSKPVPKSKLISANIVITDTHHHSGYRGGNRFYIWANGQEYIFNSGSGSDYSCSKLNDVLSIGDTINILYYENNLTSKKIILAAKSNEKIYRTYDNYLKGEKWAVPIIIVLAIFVEVIFIAVVYLEYDLNRSEFFKRRKNKKNHKDSVKS